MAPQPSGTPSFRTTIPTTVGDAYGNRPTSGVVRHAVLIAQLVMKAGDSTYNHVAPSGWTEFARTNHVASASYLYWHRVEDPAAEPAEYFWDMTHLIINTVIIQPYSGCITTGSPISGSPVTLAQNTNDATLTMPSMQTLHHDALVVGCGSTGAANTTIGTWNMGQTEVYDGSHNTSGEGHSWHAACVAQPVAGVTGTKTGTFDASKTPTSHAITFALAPPPLTDFVGWVA